MHNLMQILLLLPLTFSAVSARWEHRRDPRESMFLAPGTKRSAPYLSKRDVSKNGLPYPPPTATVPSQVPDSWTAKYHEAKDAGLIIDVPVPTASQDGLVQYPSGSDPGSQDICNWESSQCFMDDTINVAPEGVLAIGLDDGPTEAVAKYADYFKQENLTVTHFLIGLQVLTCPTCMKDLVDMQPEQHLASHSFTHTQLPLLQDLEVVADIGWSLQVIYDYSGKIPLYLRPPQGDIDRRVMSIARAVFGVQTVMWNQDFLDWCLLEPSDKETPPAVCKDVTADSVIAKYKDLADASPQNGVLLLAHEIRNASFGPLTDLIDEAKNKQWKIGPITLVNEELPWYTNAHGPGANAESINDILTTKKAFTVAGGGTTITLNDDWAANSTAASTHNTSTPTSEGTHNTTNTTNTTTPTTNSTVVPNHRKNSGAMSSLTTHISAVLGTATGLFIAALVSL